MSDEADFSGTDDTEDADDNNGDDTDNAEDSDETEYESFETNEELQKMTTELASNMMAYMNTVNVYTVIPPIDPNKPESIEKPIEEVLAELKKRMTSLRKCKTFTSIQSQAHVAYLLLVERKRRKDPTFEKAIGSTLTEFKLVEIFKKMWRTHFNEELFEIERQDVIWINVNTILTIMWNMTDASVEICEKIIQTKVHSDIIEYLSASYLAQNLLVDKERQNIVQGLLGILHQVVQKTSSAREALRKCKAVDVMQSFRECEHRLIACVALMIQAYLVTEKENETLNSDRQIFELLVNILNQSIQGVSSFSVTFSVMEVLEAMNKLTANDMNKERIVQAGALPPYVKLLQPNRPEEEQKEAAHGLWILAFKCKDDVRKEPGCIVGKLCYLITLTQVQERAQPLSL